jgi:predicted Zn-dependent protease
MPVRPVLIAGLLAATTLVPSVALCCIDVYYMGRDEGAKLIAKAESAFEQGKYDKVIDLLADDSLLLRDHRQGDRRMELVAIANIRTARPAAGVMSLRFLLKKSPDDPYLLTRLAEGLSKSKRGAEEASMILERLSKDDLVPDAKGYLVLAELRAKAKDPAGAEEARKRCTQMSGSAGECAQAAARS